jgi:FAD:protein FMN transferase
MRTFAWLTATLIVAALLTVGYFRSDADAVPPTTTRGRLLMGTLFEITAVGPTDTTATLLERAFSEIERIEHMTTDFDSASPVGRLNDTGIAGHIPSELSAMIARAERLREATGGVFDISTGTAKALWQNAEKSGFAPSADDLAHAVRFMGAGNVTIDSTNAIRVTPGTRIDLGAIAKGYAVDRALAILVSGGVTGALVNGGGDMAVTSRSSRGPWRIGIRHPRKRMSEYFGVVTLSGGAVATSGDYERGFTVGDSTYPHIIDPRTASPSRACVSVTVIAPNAELSDALATAVFVLGPEDGRALLERTPGAEGLIVTNDGKRLVGVMTTGFSRYASIDTIQVHVVGYPHGEQP